jgi:transcriptional regulator with XRE-family HTH domain
LKTLTTTLAPPIASWKKKRIVHPVRIPNCDGEGFSETIEVRVDAWHNAEGDIFLPGDVAEQIEVFKARHMGLLAPGELRKLRTTLRLTQKQISNLLQLGEKTWTRWESGRERPTRSMNILLHALRDGKIGTAWLRRFQDSAGSIQHIESSATRNGPVPPITDCMQESTQTLKMTSTR